MDSADSAQVKVILVILIFRACEYFPHKRSIIDCAVTVASACSLQWKWIGLGWKDWKVFMAIFSHISTCRTASAVVVFLFLVRLESRWVSPLSILTAFFFLF
jgi:hypothetical protein